MNINFKKVDEERLAYNDWNGTAWLWIDFEDGDIWCEVESCRDYTECDTIYVLCAKSDFERPNERIGLDNLLKLAELKHQHYKAGDNSLMINELSVLDLQ